MSHELPLEAIDINAEMDHWFDESSRSDLEFRPSPDTAAMLGSEVLKPGPPILLVILGSPAAGKSTIRHERFQDGFVTVDAADIFRRLEGERVLDFPGDMEELMDAIGQLIAHRAVEERRRIVTEVFDPMRGEVLVAAMKELGYQTHAIGIKCDDLEESERRNLNRGPHNISSYYTDDFNIRWLMEAVRTDLASARGKRRSGSSEKWPPSREH